MLITAESVGGHGVVVAFGSWRDARLPSGNVAPHLLCCREGLSRFNLRGASEKVIDPPMEGEEWITRERSF